MAMLFEGKEKEQIRSWFEERRSIIENIINKSSAPTKETLPLHLGDMIKNTDDFYNMYKIVNSSGETGELEDPVIKEAVDKAGRVARRPADLGSVVLATILDAPTALKTRAEGNRSHIFFLYGPAGTGKTFTSALAMKTLNDLHLLTHYLFNKGAFSKKSIAKGIAPLAKYVFKPYEQFAPKEVDWDKWAEDFVDAVEAYGISETRKSRKTELRNVNTLDKLKSLLSINRAALTAEGETIKAEDVVGPWVHASDVFSGMSKEDKDGWTNIIQQFGDEEFPVASVMWSENYGKEFHKALKHHAETPGRYARMGIHFEVGNDATSREMKNISETVQYDIPFQLFEGNFLETFIKAELGNDQTSASLLRQYKTILANRESLYQQTLQDLKTNLLGLFNNDKRSALIYSLKAIEARRNLIKKKGLESFIADSLRYGTNPFIMSLKKAVKVYHGVAPDRRELPSLLRERWAKFLKSFRDFEDNSSVSFGIPEVKKEPDLSIPEEAKEELEEYDEFLNLIKREGESIRNENVLKEGLKRIEETTKKAPDNSLDNDAKLFADAVDGYKGLPVSISKEDVTSIKEKVKKALEDIADKGLLFDSVSKEVDWSNKDDSLRYGSILGFARRWNNSHICKVTSQVDEATKGENVIEASIGDNTTVYIDLDELLADRSFIQMYQMSKAANRYLGEEGKSFMRNLILSAMGPSVAAHVAMSALDLYVSDTQEKERAKGIFDHLGKLVDEKGINYEYGEEDIDVFVDALKGMAQHESVEKITTPEGLKNELTSLLDKVVDLDKGEYKEEIDNNLLGALKLGFMVHDFIEKDLLDKVSDKAVEKAGGDFDLHNKIDAIIDSFASLFKEEFEMEDPDDERKKKLQDYREKLCANKADMEKHIRKGSLNIPDNVSMSDILEGPKFFAYLLAARNHRVASMW